MTDYNLRNVLASREFQAVVAALHRDYYEAWRRETDATLRALIAARADVLDDVIATLQLAGDSTDADE